MVRNEEKSLADLTSLDALINFFDDNDVGDYLSELPEVEFEVDLRQRTYIITLDRPLARKLGEIAKSQQTIPSALVNRWVREKIMEQPLFEQAST